MIRVERSIVDALPGASDELLGALDARSGAWLGCDVQAEGLYRRESIGCVDPALGFYLDGSELRVLAFTPVGHALLDHLRNLSAFESCAGGLAVRFPESTGRPHPVIDVLRGFLALFGPSFPELALYGVLSFDYYRLAGGAALPDDNQRRLVLYFPERVLVAKELGAKWVTFRFPDLKANPDAAKAAVAAPRIDREADDLEIGGHAKAVARGVERLKRGELFSLVLSQTFRRRAQVKASAAFGALRKLNPYPAMFFLNLGGGERLFGASPDLQVRADLEWVESAPVCGTYRRGADPVADADQALSLLNSDKEDASLAACADSDCNDKATVCVPGSLEVVSHRRVHFFSTIIHTIAHTRGRRSGGVDVFDILLAHSTPATVTGLPKPIAIAAIEELESTPRGWYAGAVARLGSDGSMEALTVLRAARVVGEIAEVRTGGNLLVDSDPQKEEEETSLKAETMFRVLAGSSPRASVPEAAASQRFKVSYLDCGDPMGSLLGNCLASAGCDLVTRGAGDIVVFGGGAEIPKVSINEKRPLLAVGLSAFSILAGQGARLTRLDEPRYARRVLATAGDQGFLAGTGPWEFGLYSSQALEFKNLPDGWQALLVTEDSWVLAASSKTGPQVAIFCRPDSVQSLKNGAGQRLVRASLAWLDDKMLF